MTLRRSGQGEEQPAGRRLELFDALTDAAREDFVASAVPRTVPAGARVYTQDDRQRVMYRIVEGRVWLSYSRPDGRELRYGLVGPGECLGISSLVDGQGLPQSATARTDVVLQVITRDAFARLRRTHSCVDDALMRSMLRDIRILIGYLAEASLDELPVRVARRLLLLSAPDRAGVPVVGLPQAELAAVFGVSRQSLNKVVKAFEAEGLVRLAYGEIRLVDVPALRDRAGADELSAS
ncbi:Crp/Fnr family transcriptional regulator [Pseudonocardia pini]|uniref:Crp/Fnr family transcriptional regulator n=1 Tax=Pseudonocardia pini TaxID=2758030 RepID=UPI0015F07730|nr:Crp/Fnr family transcriptional regulator [Pseudonocardia pini]